MVSGVKVLTRQMEALLSKQKFETRQNLNRSRMANSEEIQAAITQATIRVATMALRAMREADSLAKPHTRRSILEENQRPRQAGPIMSQPGFSWKVPDRYVELLNFEMGVANVLQSEAYDFSEERKVPIIKNWLDRDGLSFIHTLKNIEKEACKSSTGLFNVLKEKFRTQHSEMILSLQYCKLQRKENESAQDNWVYGFSIYPNILIVVQTEPKC